MSARDPKQTFGMAFRYPCLTLYNTSSRWGASMRRREFIALVGGAAAGWPLAARAQRTALPVIGFLGSSLPDEYTIRLRAFRQGLKDEGYIEGQNVIVEYRWAEDQNSRLPPLAAELVRRQVKVIVAGGGSPSALAAKAATATVPIVFATAVDPVAIGLVKSLDRPGGNLTGVTNMNVEIGPKRLELLRELLPKATMIAVLVNPSSRALAERFMQTLQPAARAFGMQLHVLNASTRKELDTVHWPNTRLTRFSSVRTFSSMPRSNSSLR